MQKQERRFTLAEVHTRIGMQGEVTFDQNFMSVLGVKPGDRIAFFIDTDGAVTMKGEKHVAGSSPAPPGTLKPTDVTQAALFDTGVPASASPKRRGRT